MVHEDHPLPPNWDKIKEQIFKRDGYKCKRCNSPNYLTAHHIKPRKDGWSDEEHNLVTLCGPCHNIVELDPTELCNTYSDAYQRMQKHRQRVGQRLKFERLKPKKYETSVYKLYFKLHPLTEEERKLYKTNSDYRRKLNALIKKDIGKIIDS